MKQTPRNEVDLARQLRVRSDLAHRELAQTTFTIFGTLRPRSRAQPSVRAPPARSEASTGGRTAPELSRGATRAPHTAPFGWLSVPSQDPIGTKQGPEGEDRTEKGDAC